MHLYFGADLYSGPDAIRVQLKFDIGDSQIQHSRALMHKITVVQ